MEKSYKQLRLEDRDRKVRLMFTFEPKSVYNDAYPHGGFGFLAALFKTRYRVISSRIITLSMENPADGEMLYKIEAKPGSW